MSWSLGLFIDAGGKPSGSYHSSYSKICKQLQLVDYQEVTESYQNTSYREEIRKLHTLVCRFHPNDDGSTGVKLKQILAVRNLKIYI